MAVSFLNSFLSYLVVLVVIAAVGAVALRWESLCARKRMQQRKRNRQKNNHGKIFGSEIKLLYLMQVLRENTDENHPMSTPDIIKYLENQGIHAERKSIYNDMECLADFGYDVVQVQSRLGGRYYPGAAGSLNFRN